MRMSQTLFKLCRDVRYIYSRSQVSQSISPLINLQAAKRAFREINISSVAPTSSRASTRLNPPCVPFFPFLIWATLRERKPEDYESKDVHESNVANFSRGEITDGSTIRDWRDRWFIAKGRIEFICGKSRLKSGKKGSRIARDKILMLSCLVSKFEEENLRKDF